MKNSVAFPQLLHCPLLEDLPDDAKVSVPGRDFASATNSATLRAGMEGWIASRFGARL
jgi:hypothetical protein